MVLRQTIALFVDAYRELHSKKLFWITLVLSVLIVGIFGMFGVNETGLTVLWWEFSHPLFNTAFISKELFYKFCFANFAVPIWLTWAATILALVSTASIIPDFLAGGAVELTLSKPISRIRLFLTKFATGLTFVALQVLIFSLACFFVIGFRASAWEWQILLAVPIVLLFFAYLYAICVLLGVLTRSTIASLLLTLLCWFVLFGLNTTDKIMIAQRIRSQDTLERRERAVARAQTLAEANLAKAKQDGHPLMPDGKVPEGVDELEFANPLLAPARSSLREAEESAQTWRRWSTILFVSKTILPKTSETIGLLDRYVLSDADRDLLAKVMPNENRRRNADRDPEDGDAPRARRSVEARMEDELRARSTWWVAGTSVAFMLTTLGLAAWIFRRRDF
jgi:ABC-type transport system involved in multi-copper enzyme maturation permease subunit